MKTKAAILTKLNAPLEIVDLEIPRLLEGQVLVRNSLTSVCGSQLSNITGAFPEPLPTTLGHEGVGFVEAIGPEVTRVGPGDRVLLSASKFGGIVADRPIYTLTNVRVPEIVHSKSVATFQDHCIASENKLFKLGNNIDLANAPLLGCAVPAALHAVRRVELPLEGKRVGVYGVGGVGLCIVNILGQYDCEVFVYDMNPGNIGIAKQMGAKVASDGLALDVAFECSGVPPVFRKINADYIICVGLGKGPLDISTFDIAEYERTFRGACIGKVADGTDLIEEVMHSDWSPIVGERFEGLEHINTVIDKMMRQELKGRAVINLWR